MAIIPCAACGQPMSSLSKVCGKCGADADPAAASDAIREQRRRRRRLNSTLTLHSALSVLVLIVGVIWFAWDVRRGQSGEYARYIIGAGVVGYAVTRVRQWFGR